MMKTRFVISFIIVTAFVFLSQSAIADVPADFTLSTPKKIPIRTPSRLDLPNQGLYYGFIVNNSSHFIETKIQPKRQKDNICTRIILPPCRENLKTADIVNWKNVSKTKHASNVYPFWLKLDRYNVFIRITKGGQQGAWKSFTLVLDRNYVENSPGPFTLEIEDD